jgi:hypothetical protein
VARVTGVHKIARVEAAGCLHVIGVVFYRCCSLMAKLCFFSFWLNSEHVTLDGLLQCNLGPGFGP